MAIVCLFVFQYTESFKMALQSLYYYTIQVGCIQNCYILIMYLPEP